MATLEESGTRDDDLKSRAYTSFSTSGQESLDHKSLYVSDDKPETPYQQGMWQGVAHSKCCKFVDTIVTMMIIALVWAMMALPTITYLAGRVKQSSTTHGHEVHEPGSTNATCTLYDGNDTRDYCITHLQQYTHCLRDHELMLSETENIMVITPSRSKISEMKMIRDLLIMLARPQCFASAEPLLCLLFIHVCDNGTGIGPNKKQCDHVLKVCDRELELINKRYGHSIDPYLLECSIAESPFDNKTCDITTKNTSNQTLDCSDGFFYNEGRCTPECVVWTPFSKIMILITDVLTIFSAVIGVIAGIAVLLTSMLRHQRLCHYPSIFVVYQTIPAMVPSVLVFIGVSARYKLFCRSRDLLQSFEKPTPFCFITGVVFYYIVIQLLFWWLWHTIAVFWTVVRPFQKEKTSTQRKHGYLHAGLVLASLILPVLPVLIVVFAGKEYRYRSSFTLTRSPPILCSGIDLHTNFWGVIFPISLMLGCGTNLLVLILRTVIKKHVLSKLYGIRIISTLTLEFKVLIILCYYVVLGAAVLTIFTHDLSNLNKKSMILKYFKCESMGMLHTNDSICFHSTQSIQKLLNPIPTTIATVILGFLPVVNLLYVIKFKNKKKIYSQIRHMQYSIVSKWKKRAGHKNYALNMNYDHKTSTLLDDSRTSNTGILITPQGTLNRDHSSYY